MNVQKDERWSTHNITGKWKQTKLSKMVSDIDKSFNVFLYSSKHPAWDLFKNIPFDIIILETEKNYEQMSSIILENKIPNLKCIKKNKSGQPAHPLYLKSNLKPKPLKEKNFKI